MPITKNKIDYGENIKLYYKTQISQDEKTQSKKKC